MRAGKLAQYSLFIADDARSRKLFVASFEERIDAISAAEKLKNGGPTRWQVVDVRSNEVVAEDPGS